MSLVENAWKRVLEGSLPDVLGVTVHQLAVAAETGVWRT
jgi:hypothetical protein